MIFIEITSLSSGSVSEKRKQSSIGYISQACKQQGKLKVENTMTGLRTFELTPRDRVRQGADGFGDVWRVAMNVAIEKKLVQTMQSRHCQVRGNVLRDDEGQKRACP